MHLADASPCGPHVVATLRECLKTVAHSTSSTENAYNRCYTMCGLLVKQAEEAISTFPYSEVPDHWRRLYMDASLLQVAGTLSHSVDMDFPRAELLDLVKILDMANIVTGYFEQGRERCLFALMQSLQQLLGNYDSDVVNKVDRPNKRARKATGDGHGRPPGLLPGIKAIRRFAEVDAPGMDELSQCKEPFIVSGGVSHWPAIQRWADETYLRRIAGEGRIVPVEIGASYTAEGWTQKMMAFSDFLDQINWMQDPTPNPNATGPPVYLAQHDLFQQFPELLQDIVKPDYLWACPEAPDHFPEYRPPASGFTLNAWLGPSGSYSPAHTDPYFNCYAQVVGKKHIWVCPPCCSSDMVGYEQDEGANDDTAADDNAACQHFMINTAHMDVFAVSSSLDKKHKRFRTRVAPLAQQAILQEGDLLFMPPKSVSASIKPSKLNCSRLFDRWWHAIKALERSFSVSMWI